MTYLNVEEVFNKLKPTTLYSASGFELKEGQNLVNCPFHDDSNPSMSVNTKAGEKGVFCCHACGAKGDMITFYMKYHNVDFKTALRQINEKFSLKLKEKKKEKEWIVKPLRLNKIDLNSEIIKKYFKLKNIPKPLELIECFGLKCCENNEALAIAVGKRWKLKAFDDRGDRWDVSDVAIEPIYYSLSSYTGQKNLLVIEGFSNLFSLWCYADEKFKKDFFVVTSVHGVASTPDVIEQLAKESKHFETISVCTDNDEQGQKTAQKIVKDQQNACNVVLSQTDLRDYLRENTIDDLYNLLINTKSLSTKVNEDVEKLKRNPNKLQELIDDVHKLGVVGEVVNIAIVFLCMISHKLDSCLGFILKGHYSSGKSQLVNTIAKLMPTGVVLPISSLAKQALNYMEDLAHKVLLETEAHRSDDIEYWEIDSQFRQLITEHEITRAVPEKDEKTGKYVTSFRKTKGPISYGTTTTQDKTKDENESRLFGLRTDDSYEHLQKVKEMQDKKAMGLWISEEEQQLIIAKWQKFVEQLPPFKLKDIIIPYSNKLNMKCFGAPVSREYEKLLKIIKVFTWFNRAVAGSCENGGAATETLDNTGLQGSCGITSRNRDKLISTPEDYKCIYPLVKEFFDTRAEEVDQETQRDFERAKRILTPIWTRGSLGNSLHKGRDATEKLIFKWIKHNMAEELDKRGPHNAKQYSLNLEWEPLGAELVDPTDLINETPNDKTKDSSRSHPGDDTATNSKPNIDNTSSCWDEGTATDQQLDQGMELSDDVLNRLKELNAVKSNKN